MTASCPEFARIVTGFSVVCFSLFPPTVHSQDCDPPCRSGFECKNGLCVSACNPPCPENQVCDPKTHDCVPVAPVSSESGEHHNTGGFAIGSAITGFVVSPIILGLTIGSAANSGEGKGLVPSLPLGASALGVGIITVPIFAAGGASARSSDKVNGILALRIVGWCGYGLSVGTGAALIGMAVAGATIQPAMIAACGGLGTVSCLSMSIDALVSGSQAKRYYANAGRSGVDPELTLSVGPYLNDGALTRLSLGF